MKGISVNLINISCVLAIEIVFGEKTILQTVRSALIHCPIVRSSH
jgi:hypothetical protein